MYTRLQAKSEGSGPARLCVMSSGGLEEQLSSIDTKLV